MDSSLFSLFNRRQSEAYFKLKIRYRTFVVFTDIGWMSLNKFREWIPLHIYVAEKVIACICVNDTLLLSEREPL